MSFAFPFFLKNGVKKKRDYVEQQNINNREQVYPTLASMIQSRQSPDPSPTSSSRSHPITVTPPSAPAYPLEPEELEDNRFYQYIRSHFNQIFSRSSVVCIPHSRSLEGLVLTKDFIETHSYNASPYYRGQYQAANGKVISIEHLMISTVNGFREQRTVYVKAEEWVYISNKKIRVFMIERPLEGEPPRHYHNVNTISIPVKRNSRTDLDFLTMFPENTEALNELQLTVEEFVNTYVYIRGFNSYTVEKIQHIYVKAYKTILQRNKLLRDACRIQSEHDHFLEQVENVVMGFLHEKIWIHSLRSILQSQDNYLQSISRAYAKESIPISRYGVSHPISEMPLSCFTKAIQCLRCVDMDIGSLPLSFDDERISNEHPAFTPLEKLVCVKLTLDLISEAVDKYMKSTTVDSNHNDSFVTTDEMIPMLAYVLMHSQISRLASLAFYMEHFRLSHIERSEHSFALVTLKTAIEFLKGDPLSLLDACSGASTLSSASTSSAILSPQIQSLRTRSTSFGSPLSSPPASTASSHASHYRSTSLTSQNTSQSTYEDTTPTATNSLPLHHHHPSHHSHHHPSHPATARVLHHRKSQSADLQNIIHPPIVTVSVPMPDNNTPYERHRRNSLSPSVVVRPPIVLPGVRENRKSLDIPNDWMLHSDDSCDLPSSSIHTHSRSSPHTGLKNAPLSYTRPIVSTTFPTISSASVSPTTEEAQYDHPREIYPTTTSYTADTNTNSGTISGSNNNNNSSSSNTPTYYHPIALSTREYRKSDSIHNSLPDTPRLAQSLSTTATTAKRAELYNQPPTIINIRDRVSFDSMKRPASICMDTRSMNSNGSQEEVDELMGDFLRGLQSMEGDIVGERSGSFRSYRHL
ncbi:hypothetical protein BDF14DRAFT_1824849 [Spinellus fusiger]|nr:hypothetical protein BDF14DRAFT_1824849 [Spinellus fusiger]